MKKQLLVLNLVLIALASAAAWKFRQEWLRDRARSVSVLGKSEVASAAVPPLVQLPAPQPVTAASYEDIAQKMLFSRDRNPDVEIEEKAAPPPKPMPKLPTFYGVLAIGDSVTAILSEKVGARQRGFRPGESVGEFKLVSANANDIVFSWEGQEIRKKVDDLIDRTAQQPVPNAPGMPPASPSTPASLSLGQTSNLSAKDLAAPGASMGGAMRACQPGDDSPAGAVVDGMKKVSEDSPFGKKCWWEPVK